MPLLVAGLVALATIAAAPPPDLRTVVVLNENCRSTIAERQLTLFANGTVRLRLGPPGSETMSLLELPPGDLATYLNQLGELDWSDTDVSQDAPRGEWTESCELDLALPGRTPRTLSYGRFASGSLALEKERRVVDDLIARTTALGAAPEIPTAYLPREGDRLERTDGLIFEIVGFTSDGKGIELSGVESPLTIYVQKSELRHSFRRVLSRGETP